MLSLHDKQTLGTLLAVNMVAIGMWEAEKGGGYKKFPKATGTGESKMVQV